MDKIVRIKTKDDKAYEAARESLSMVLEGIMTDEDIVGAVGVVRLRDNSHAYFVGGEMYSADVALGSAMLMNNAIHGRQEGDEDYE